MSETVEIEFDVDGRTHKLSGIPTRVWEQFCAQALLLFPSAGKDAWSSFIAEFVMAQSANRVNHLLTDIPPEVAAVLERNLEGVKLDWASLHRYILTAASKGTLELARMSEGGPGIVIVLGIPESVLKRFPMQTEGVHAAEAFSILLLGASAGGKLTWNVEELKSDA